MNLRFWYLKLRPKRPFRISRETTYEKTTVLVGLEEDGLWGLGEAVPYPFYGDTLDAVVGFLKSAQNVLKNFSSFELHNVEKELHRLYAKVEQKCEEFRIDKEKCMGTAEFQLKPGVVTICRLIEHDGEFKMLITRGEIEKSDQELRGSWSWVKVQDLDLLYRVIVEEGFTHHASMIHGDYTKPIADACKLLGIEVVQV